jgi:cell division protein FtsI/penicillin-binding protein 2
VIVSRSEFRHRTLLLAGFSLLLVGGLGLRLAWLQVAQHGHYQGLARSQHWGADRIPAERGSIYLRDLASGTTFPVAISDERRLVYAVPAQLKDPGEAARRLAPVLGKSVSDIQKAFGQSQNYTVLARRVDLAVAQKIEELDLAGIGLTPEPVRVYPEGRLAASVIGFTNGDLVGQYGLERAFHETLAGEDGYRRSEKDSNGIPIAGSSGTTRAPKDGAALVITLDRNIQQAAEAALKANVEKYRADSGSLAMMDPSSGEILAMASYPDYDPNRYGEVTDYSRFGNQPVEAAYEPGSVFKVVTMAAGVDSGKFKPETKFTDSGQVTIQGHTIQNADRKAHGEVDMSYVLARSLNVGTVHSLSLMGEETFYRYVKKFGFGTPTGIEFDSEGSGRLLPQKSYGKLDMASLTFGQGIVATPLQLLSAVGSIANGGQMVQPRVVVRVEHAEGKIEETSKRVIRETVSRESAAQLTTMLVNAVDNGWGKPASIPGYKVAGKTGTAQIPRKDGKGYEEGATIGSFVGFAPAENPRFVMITRLDRPKGVSFSEEPAAHLWREVGKFTLDYFQVPPSS